MQRRPCATDYLWLRVVIDHRFVTHGGFDRAAFGVGLVRCSFSVVRADRDLVEVDGVGGSPDAVGAI